MIGDWLIIFGCALCLSCAGWTYWLYFKTLKAEKMAKDDAKRASDYQHLAWGNAQAMRDYCMDAVRDISRMRKADKTDAKEETAVCHVASDYEKLREKQQKIKDILGE
jgi:hypothetical protein